jgi:DNA gyrase subunit A
MGRSTQGVTLISLDDGTWLAGIERVAESDTEAVLGAAEAEDDAGDAPSDPAGPAEGEGSAE